MSRKRIGGGMMVSLALLAGCSQSQKTVDVSGIFPSREDAARTSTTSAKPPARPVNPFAQNSPVAVLPPDVQYVPPMPPLPEVVGQHAPPNSPLPEVVGQHAPPTSPIPEVVGVSVAANRMPGGLQPAGVIPAQMPPAPPPASPAVEPVLTAAGNVSSGGPQGTLPEVRQMDPVPTAAGNVPAPETPSIVQVAASEEQPQGTLQLAPAVAERKLPEVPRNDVTAPEPEQSLPPVPEVASPSKFASVPGYGHADDYGWLMGELQYFSARNVWRLRYAPADQEDRYGGAVQLVGEGVPADHTSGEMVRVEGQLVNPDSGDPRPSFWVRGIRSQKAGPVSGE
jgi:hypothetical protein